MDKKYINDLSFNFKKINNYDFYQSFMNLEKVRILTNFSLLSYRINTQLSDFFKFNKKEINHDYYQNNIIHNINKNINFFRKNQLDFFYLMERPLNDLSYNSKLINLNKRKLLFEKINNIPNSCVNILSEKKFKRKKLTSDIIYNLNDVINEIELLRIKTLNYFQNENIIIEHGLFQKFNTNFARKTNLEKTDLQIKLQSNLHNTRNLLI